MTEQPSPKSHNPTNTPINKGLGRVFIPDKRDKNYQLQRPAKLSDRRYRYWYNRGVLDQEISSACVGFSAYKYLEAGPVRNKVLPFSPYDLYQEAQRNDQWPGEEPEYFGTSVRAVFKVLQDKKYIDNYYWAFDVDTAVNHILEKGPMVFGTDWYEDMFFPDKDGFIKIGGQLVGGHAYLIIGVNRDKICPDGSKGAFRILNSWGLGWGQNGKVWLPFTYADRLIEDYGEACCANEILI